MHKLGPLKFKPIPREMIWGGEKLREVYKKPFPVGKKIGESWELSTVRDSVSVVAGGYLDGNTLEEVIEIYMGELVGDKIFERFGAGFPLLIKFIDANDDLSVQVHPGDQLASLMHDSSGKTEMWYVLYAEPGARLINGFNREIDGDTIKKKLEEGSLSTVLNYEKVSAGDIFYIPAGRIHSIGKGIMLAEIQQSSDITYRVYDWNRVDHKGKGRELHLDMALKALDFSASDDTRLKVDININQPTSLVECDSFITNLIHIDKPVARDMHSVDSFVIYLCTRGTVDIEWEGGVDRICTGETILVPAYLAEYKLLPLEDSTVLEVFIKQDS